MTALLKEFWSHDQAALSDAEVARKGTGVGVSGDLGALHDIGVVAGLGGGRTATGRSGKRSSISAAGRGERSHGPPIKRQVGAGDRTDPRRLVQTAWSSRKKTGGKRLEEREQARGVGRHGIVDGMPSHELRLAGKCAGHRPWRRDIGCGSSRGRMFEATCETSRRKLAGWRTARLVGGEERRGCNPHT